MSGAVSVDEGEKPQTTPEERPLTWKERWVPRLKLMAGLLLPVYLETLDYTGMLLCLLEVFLLAVVTQDAPSRCDSTDANRKYLRQTRYSVVHRHR
jgi:hypothetical protein